jgi:hypothetical protein
MIVGIGVPHTASIQKQRMVKQVSVRFRSRFEFLQKLCKERDVELINLCDLG